MTPEDEAFEDLAKRQGDWGMQGSRKHQIMRYVETVEIKGANMTDKQLFKMALDALNSMKETLAEHGEPTTFNEDEAITAIKEALAQPEQEQEPVAWAHKESLESIKDFDASIYAYGGFDDAVPLYAHPPQRTEPVIDKSAAIRIATVLGWTPPRTWVGLTDEEIWTVLQFRGYNTDTIEIARAIEARLKERNT